MPRTLSGRAGARSPGRTALFGAAFWGWSDVVDFLVERGAKIDVAERGGLTPVDAAHGPRRRPRPRLDDRSIRRHGSATARALRATNGLRSSEARRRFLSHDTDGGSMSAPEFARALLAFVVLSLSGHAAAQRNLPPLTIEQLTPHVYRYGGLTNGAFVVGSEGIAVIDGQICGSERHAMAQGRARETLRRAREVHRLEPRPRDAHLRARGVQRHGARHLARQRQGPHRAREAPHGRCPRSRSKTACRSTSAASRSCCSTWAPRTRTT